MAFLNSIQPWVWKFYIIPITAVVLVFLIYLVFRRRRTRTQKDYNDTATDAMPENPIECRVYDRTTRGISYQNIAVADIIKIREKCGGLGRKWLRDGKEVFALVKIREGEYEPALPAKSLDNLPSIVHRKLTDVGAVKVFFDMKVQKGFMEKNGWVIALGIGAVVVIFLAVSGK